MLNKCAKFHGDSPSGEKLNSISREQLNFRRRPFLCTTLYRNLMQASNFGGTFDQLFLWTFFMKFSQKMPLYLFYTMVQKSQKWPKTQIKGGPALKRQCHDNQCRVFSPTCVGKNNGDHHTKSPRLSAQAQPALLRLWPRRASLSNRGSSWAWNEVVVVMFADWYRVLMDSLSTVKLAFNSHSISLPALYLPLKDQSWSGECCASVFLFFAITIVGSLDRRQKSMWRAQSVPSCQRGTELRPSTCKGHERPLQRCEVSKTSTEVRLQLSWKLFYYHRLLALS